MRSFVVGLLVISVVACSRAPAVIMTGPVTDAVRARQAAYGAALNRHDAAAVNEFCRTCMIVDAQEDEHGPYAKVSIGNESLVRDPGSVVDFGYFEVDVSGSLAVSHGECSVTRTSPRSHQPVLRRGDCMTTWVTDEAGVWRVRYESRNVWPPLH